MKNILFIVGPTATGKTSFAIEVAKQFNGELISADSRQVYRSLDIVTGKDHGDIPIHLIDILNPDQPFSVSQWHDMAVQKIQEIQSKHKLPIVVGGTGFYIKSLISYPPGLAIPPNPPLREELSKLSASELFNKLNRDFPPVAASLNESDAHNPRRLIRKYEIAAHGLLKTSPQSVGGGQAGEDFKIIGLTCPIGDLDQRIDRRVEIRMKMGASQEAQEVLNKYPHNLPSLSACGYLAFLKPDPVSAWKTAEHQYARRQLTWFKKQPSINWFDISQPDWRSSAFNFITKVAENNI